MKRKYGDQKTNLVLNPLAAEIYNNTDPLEIYEDENGLYSIEGVIEKSGLSAEEVSQCILNFGYSLTPPHFDADSFGGELPKDWEFIVDDLNQFAEACPWKTENEVWEEFWGGPCAYVFVPHDRKEN